ncbi:hypothetical protein [Wenxinia marina]|uniref:Uncharacterized protein n=1 Tax=Wenxinia marina DSM 24838 TaxID=1123501 RepID=A0A0D0NLS4_9RHOB|nr:hypothetical protein [Wenxinia marina]KIQ69195.1 hypothetical protein Wenmar_02266 [Wenxinia marina DSM 24838]GGL71082.1 hypothetical protein GCM10011392_27030 [Wenxinia marina]
MTQTETRPLTPIERAWVTAGGQPRSTDALPPERLTDRQKRMAAAAPGPGIDPRLLYSIGTFAVILLTVVTVKLALGVGWRMPGANVPMATVPAGALRTDQRDPLSPALEALGAVPGPGAAVPQDHAGALDRRPASDFATSPYSGPRSASPLRRGGAGAP